MLHLPIESKFGRMVSIEPRTSRKRMVSYKLEDGDANTSLYSAGSVLSLDSEVDVIKPSEMVSCDN